MPAEPFELFFSEGFGASWHARDGKDLGRAYDWQSLDPRGFEPRLVEAVRSAWTHQALAEYGTAVSMAQLLEALCRARVPVDLLAMASTFCTEELSHAELYARLAMQMGGGTPVLFAPEKLGIALAPDLTLEQRANELVVRLCCVGEAFSMPMLAAGLQVSTQPLVREVLQRVVREEALHGRLGWLYLDWVSDQLSDAERTRLGGVARDMVNVLAAQWLPLRKEGGEHGVTSAGFNIGTLHGLGWLAGPAYRAQARSTLEAAVVAPLARHGIAVDLPTGS